MCLAWALSPARPRRGGGARPGRFARRRAPLLIAAKDPSAAEPARPAVAENAHHRHPPVKSSKHLGCAQGLRYFLDSDPGMTDLDFFFQLYIAESKNFILFN